MRALKARGKKGFNYWLMSFRDREQSSCWLRPNVSKNTHRHTYTFQNRYKKSLESKVKGKNIAQKNSKTKQKGKKRTQNSNSRRWELGNWWGVLFWAELVFMALFLGPIFLSKRKRSTTQKVKSEGPSFCSISCPSQPILSEKALPGKVKRTKPHTHTPHMCPARVDWPAFARTRTHTHTHSLSALPM